MLFVNDYWFTLESSKLMTFLVSKRDLFQLNNQNNFPDLSESSHQDLFFFGGIELLFTVLISPAFVPTYIRMEFADFRELIISDHHRLGTVDLKNCFAAR